jgi:hypothetical protein
MALQVAKGAHRLWGSPILLLTAILLGLALLTLVVIVVLPILLWRALGERQGEDDVSVARPRPSPLSFHDRSIWRAFLAWRRSRPQQLEHHRDD